MNHHHLSTCRTLLAAGLFLFSVALMAQQNTPPCAQPEAGQFDFWLGSWELTWPGGQGGTPEGQQGKGRNVIERILGSCVIQENFSRADSSYIGKSWSVYNPIRNLWQQTWVDNTGGYLVFTGEFKAGRMELRTAPFERNGKTFISRMVFHNIQENSFDWDWQRSADEGQSWQDLWNIRYERIKDEG